MPQDSSRLAGQGKRCRLRNWLGASRVGEALDGGAEPGLVVHALLAHLESAGFEGAPRFLGIDGAGREALSYIDGEVAGRPRPPWIADQTRLASVGRLVRAYDDAAASFALPSDVLPDPRSAGPPGLPPAPAYPPELIGHVDAPRRARVLADAYGLSGTDRERIIEVAILRTRRSWHLMKQRAETHGGGWQRMWGEGVGYVIKRREAWLDRHAATLTAALTAQ